ncbi:uncharacterized protein LOC124190809 [Daphnia pulex]|uniref:uncharacterized protein LOC124190809 n=1 Tax=Daphnia pulex TaxID=6669 RepID=UPI001EDCCAFF|nr:uncharacterized protein LOC124190809 [Daphnia pulex]
MTFSTMFLLNLFDLLSAAPHHRLHTRRHEKVIRSHFERKNNGRDFHEGHSASFWDWRSVEEDLRARNFDAGGCRRPRTHRLVTNCPRRMSVPTRRHSSTCAKCATTNTEKFEASVNHHKRNKKFNLCLCCS